MAKLLKGGEVSRAIHAKLAETVSALAERGITPCLAAVECGAEADNASYVRSMRRGCEKLGIAFRHVTLDAACTEGQLAATLQQLNADDAVHGLMVLQPLPAHISAAVLQTIAPAKDVDGVTHASRLLPLGIAGVGFLPCTAEACMVLLRHYGIELRGKRAAVVGRSAVVGQPLSLLLTAADATVTLCHSRTQDLAACCREADIVIAAAGRPRLLTAQHLRAGQTVLDVGIHVLADGSMCGDVDFAAAEAVVDAVTPVPGGVGSVTSALLMQHVVQAAAKSIGGLA